jgi:hypothetical protein
MVGLEFCNKTLRVLYGEPSQKARGYLQSTGQGENLDNCRTKGKKRNAIATLPTIRLDSVHLLGGMIHACHGLFFLGRSAIGATGGAAGRAGIVESLHDRVEAIFW